MKVIRGSDKNIVLVMELPLLLQIYASQATLMSSALEIAEKIYISMCINVFAQFSIINNYYLCYV